MDLAWSTSSKWLAFYRILTRSGRHIARIVHFVPHSDRFPSQRVIYVCHVYCPGSRSVDLPPKEHRPLFTHRFEIVDIPERVIILSKSAKFKNRYPNDLRLAICHYRRLRRENSNAERIWTILSRVRGKEGRGKKKGKIRIGLGFSSLQKLELYWNRKRVESERMGKAGISRW